MSSINPKSEYDVIVSEFPKQNPDIITICRTMIDSCKNDSEGEMKMRNMLLLITALFHKNEEIDRVGYELWSMKKEKIDTVLSDLEYVFSQDDDSTWDQY
ncbi:MAG: hypothetical protein ACTSWN_15540 [Promethearchaeota archaeon]